MPIGKIPPPTTGVTDAPLTCIEISSSWIPYLLAMVSPARYPEFWAGTLEQNRFARLETQNLLNLLMMAGGCDMPYCCDDNYVIQRLNPTTGLLERSADNGMSWTPSPNSFVPHIVEPQPPVTSGVAGTKCDAATNVMGRIEYWIDHVTNDFDTATDLVAFGFAVIAAIADAILLILSAGTLTAIEGGIISAIAAAIAAIWAAGKTVFSGYWTDSIKHQILCSLYANIGEDGSFSDAQFSAFWNDLNQHLAGGVAKGLFMGFLSSVGRQGLNSMAASGASSGADCSSCDNPCSFIGSVEVCIGTDFQWISDCVFTLRMADAGSSSAAMYRFGNPTRQQAKFSVEVEGGAASNFGLTAATTCADQSDAVSYSGASTCYYGGFNILSGNGHTNLVTVTIIEGC